MSEEDFEGLGLVDLIALLEEVPEPPPPSLWPQTWGWIALTVLVVLGVWLLLRRRRRHRVANAYRKEALVQIEAAGDDAAALALVLRRAALSAYPRRDVAGLTGDAWLAFLDETGDGDSFRSDTGQALAEAPYRQVACPPDLPRARCGLDQISPTGPCGSRDVIELVFPWALIFLPLPLLVWWLAPPHRTRIRALRVPFFRSIVESAGVASEVGVGSIAAQPIPDASGSPSLGTCGVRTGPSRTCRRTDRDRESRA